MLPAKTRVCSFFFFISFFSQARALAILSALLNTSNKMVPPPWCIIITILYYTYTEASAPSVPSFLSIFKIHSVYIYSILHRLLAYSLCLFITAKKKDVQWGACTLEHRETLGNMLLFHQIKIAGALPQKNSCLVMLVSC